MNRTDQLKSAQTRQILSESRRYQAKAIATHYLKLMNLVAHMQALLKFETSPQIDELLERHVSEIQVHHLEDFGIELKWEDTNGQLPSMPALPTLENRTTVPPVAGHRFYTRSGRTLRVTQVSPNSGNYCAKLDGGHPILIYPDGKANDPANDLVSECPF